MTRSPGCAHRRAVPTGTAFGRIYCDERMIRCTRVYCEPRCVCNFGGKRNDLKARGFHKRQLNPTQQAAHRRNSGKEFLVGSARCADRTPQRGVPTICQKWILFYRARNSTTARAASAIIAARSSAEDVEPIE